MIRFTSTELRPLLSQQGETKKPLLLEKKNRDIHPGSG
ncbi:Uncharacterised protein [Citrobacter koseri]|nr:Uncharacterised protein [Citrobacter koseri]